MKGILMTSQTLLTQLFLCFCALSFFFPGTLKGQEEVIQVTLKTDQPLFMAYIPSIKNSSSKYSETYLNALRGVLLFDFDNNGSTYTPDSEIAKKIEGLLAEKDSKTALPIDELSNLGLAYLIQIQMSESSLEPKVIQILSNTARSVSPITCTGSLDQDRVKLHQLSSFIHEMLFNSPSIATSKILWVSKYKKSEKNNEPKYTSEIFTSDYDGYNKTQVAPHMDTLLTTPIWVPQVRPGYITSKDHPKHVPAQSFVFVSYQLGQPKLYLSPLKSFKPIRITTVRGNQMMPALSPNGMQLAFCCDTTGTSDLYLVEFNQATGASSKPRQLFRSPGSATGCPAFSSDGKRIAFVSNKDGSPRIYVMDIPPITAQLKDIKPTLLTKRCNENSAPSWSPDGRKLAYSAKNSKEVRQIWIYDFTTGKETKLTEGEGDKESPAWASNSLHLTYHSTKKDGTSSLFLISLRKPTPVCIVKGKEAFQFATWEPGEQMSKASFSTEQENKT
jgi:TolB protein